MHNTFSFESTIFIISNPFTFTPLFSFGKILQQEAYRIGLEATLDTFSILFFCFAVICSEDLLLLFLIHISMPSAKAMIYRSNRHIHHLFSYRNYP